MDVKLLREQTGLTQEELAEKAGIPRDRIAKWEQGKGKPKVSDYLKLEPIFKELIPKAGDRLPLGEIVITMKDYISEIKQQKEFLQELLMNRIEKIDSNLDIVVGKSEGLQFDLISGREVVLKSLARLEKKPDETLLNDADNLRSALAVQADELSKKPAAGKSRN